MSHEKTDSVAKISAEGISKLCIDKFKALPKTGKPSCNEWTVLAGVVIHNRISSETQVVSIGCGTKCISKSKICTRGLVLNDSHAEVMARRAFIRYLYHQLNRAIAGDNLAIFEWVKEKQKFQIRSEISLHFFSSQTPCGDACIIDGNTYQEFDEEPLVKKCKLDVVKPNEENIGSAIDVVYTGAKLLGDYHSDAMEQVAGAVRTKPGRGERTLSMSCSDKLARWQILGVQGALLDCILAKPIYFDTLNFSGCISIDSLERAIWKRFKNSSFQNKKYELYVPKIRLCNRAKFQYAQDNAKQPSPNGIVWCDIPNDMKPYEISVNGKKQGTTSNIQQIPHSALKISKFYLLKEFLNVVKLKPDLLCNYHNLNTKTYTECKMLSKDYQQAWSDLKLHYFKQWIEKPNHLLNFTFEKFEK